MTRQAIALLAVVALVGCDRPTAPTPHARSVSGSPSFAAGGHTFNEKVETSFLVYSPCTGELILVQGTVHFWEDIVATPNGQDIRYHFNTQDTFGVGLVSGLKYKFNEVAKVDETVTFVPGFTIEEDVTFHYRVISQGNADNFLVDVSYHFSYPPGTVTYTKNEARCVG